jgi:hypothetical protein
MFDTSLVRIKELGYPVLGAYFTDEMRKQFEDNVQIM